MKKMGIKRGMVVHGGGMDEISNFSETSVCEVRNGRIEKYTLSPEDFGLKRSSLSDIVGGDVERNANSILSVFSGDGGAKRDVILMNASATLYLSSDVSDFCEGVEVASNIISDGLALQKLNEMREFGREM